MKYSEQIKSPKWQKRRLDILNRDEFTCQQCGNKELTLHVHHKQYRKNASIWEYENWELTTLCEKCHSDTHKEIKPIKKKIPERFIKYLEYLNEGDLEDLGYFIYLINLYAKNGNYPKFLSYLAEAITDESIDRIYNEIKFLSKQRHKIEELTSELANFQCEKYYRDKENDIFNKK